MGRQITDSYTPDPFAFRVRRGACESFGSLLKAPRRCCLDCWLVSRSRYLRPLMGIAPNRRVESPEFRARAGNAQRWDLWE